MPTPDEARRALAEGRASRPGAGNPYADTRVLGQVWAIGKSGDCPAGVRRVSPTGS
ncbi:hypothetical protein RND64_13710 [Gordonia sp. w5E2]|uniref:ribosome modulation factor n=1 Tax=Gordonia TaxID=2053 RepID=UPI001364BEDE|nr:MULTISPECIES: hypothetical protein [Gordonia]